MYMDFTYGEFVPECKIKDPMIFQFWDNLSEQMLTCGPKDMEYPGGEYIIKVNKQNKQRHTKHIEF